MWVRFPPGTLTQANRRQMDEKSEPNQNDPMAEKVSFGEPSFFFAAERIRDFSHSVLRTEAWFRTADELIAAMDLLEPHVEGSWEDVRSVAFAVDMTSAVPSKRKKSAAP